MHPAENRTAPELYVRTSHVVCRARRGPGSGPGGGLSGRGLGFLAYGQQTTEQRHVAAPDPKRPNVGQLKSRSAALLLLLGQLDTY
jgi:hypothetical protein